MEIANLLKPKPDSPSVETFLAIQIQEGLVKTALWQVVDALPQVITYGSTQNFTDPSSLPEAVDTSLTHALANQDSEPNRVLFGVPESWFRNNQISSEYKDIITDLCRQLELKPVGLVSLTDAVISHLKDKEGIPPSVILVEVGDTKINVCVVRLGSVKGREEVDRSDDLAADVAEGLARIDTDQLPSRFLILNGNDGELEQQLTSYSWMDKFPFLHLPKVEAPDPHFSIEAIATSGGSEAARSLGLEVSEPTTPTQTEEAISSPLAKTTQLSGFVIDQEPLTATSTPPTPSPALSSSRSALKLPSIHLPALRLPPISLPKLRLPRIQRTPLLFLPVAIVALLATALFVATYFLKSAEIKLLLKPYSLTKSFPININSSTPPSLSATPQMFEIEKSADLPTTGEATVGDKATGEVTVFNKTDASRTLDKGTLLTTTNNLRFYLDDSVTVASRSSTPTPDGLQITFGRANVKVTATKIGTESNLPSNTSLSVANFPLSSVEAKVASELTGGTSRTVRAVSKDDQQKLFDTVLDQVKQEAAEKISTAGADQAVPTSNTDVTKQTFNKGVGEEAETLSLTIQATVTLLRYRPDDLKAIAADLAKADVPSGYRLDPANLQVSLENVQVEGDQTTATTVATAQLLPDVDINSYRTALRGKSVTAARQLLSNLTGYEGVEIATRFNFPLMANRLPARADRINLTIAPAP